MECLVLLTSLCGRETSHGLCTGPRPHAHEWHGVYVSNPVPIHMNGMVSKRLIAEVNTLDSKIPLIQVRGINLSLQLMLLFQKWCL